MQPLLNSTSFSSARLRLTPRCTSLPSMLISLMSLTITATRRFSRFFRTWLSRVLLPTPRKPDSTVTGRRFMGFSQALGSVYRAVPGAPSPRWTASWWGAAAGASGRSVRRYRGTSRIRRGPGYRAHGRSCRAASFALQHAQLPLALLFGAADVGRIAAGLLLAQHVEFIGDAGLQCFRHSCRHRRVVRGVRLRSWGVIN